MLCVVSNEMSFNLKTHGRNSFFRIFGLSRTFGNEGLTGVMTRWSGRQGAEAFGKDLAAMGTIAAGGIVATRALGSINVASDDALNSAASAAGNLLGYRMTMNAMNMIPGLGV